MRSALILDQPEVFLHPDSSSKGIKADQIKALADGFGEAVAVRLIDAYPIVDEPGPNALRLRLALTNVYMKRSRGKIWITPIGVVRTGPKAAAGKNISLEEATIEAELVDSVTASGGIRESARPAPRPGARARRDRDLLG